MTQSELVQRSGRSLPTIQGMESGRANPSLSTLESVLEPLGMRLRIEERPADWDVLCALGLPLSSHKVARVVPHADLLAAQVLAAARDLARSGDGGREAEALQALVLALVHHFPTFHRTRLAGSPHVRSLVERPVSGRVIKLERIARSALAEYL